MHSVLIRQKYRCDDDLDCMNKIGTALGVKLSILLFFLYQIFCVACLYLALRERWRRVHA